MGNSCAEVVVQWNFKTACEACRAFANFRNCQRHVPLDDGHTNIYIYMCVYSVYIYTYGYTYMSVYLYT